MADERPADRRAVSGWGRTSPALCRTLHLPDTGPGAAGAPAARAVLGAGPRGVLGRGRGRSYGDAAQNAGGTLLALGRGPVVVDAAAATVTAGGGSTMGQLLAACLPHGLVVPVLPGTRHVSVGGAVAADVHGKNHLRNGTFSRWLTEVVLLDGCGTVRVLRPDDSSAAAFWATVGGMGLTGLVLQATLRLQRVPSSWLVVRDRRAPDLEALLELLEGAARSSAHAVAWVDALARGRHLGRGVVSAADPAAADRVPPGADPLGYAAPRAARAPQVPASVVRPVTVRAFNAAWWRRSGREDERVSALPTFAHPLDALRGWNRLYGPAGFVQYQLVVPDGGEDVLAEALALLQAARTAPFLGVVKRFGAAGPAPLSFPRPGWSLAVDLPVGPAGLPAALDRLDRRVAACGGAVYLAKDARLTPELLAGMYPRLPQWRAAQAGLDPEGRLQSDLDRRLGLVSRA